MSSARTYAEYLAHLGEAVTTPAQHEKFVAEIERSARERVAVLERQARAARDTHRALDERLGQLERRLDRLAADAGTVPRAEAAPPSPRTLEETARTVDTMGRELASIEQAWRWVLDARADLRSSGNPAARPTPPATAPSTHETAASAGARSQAPSRWAGLILAALCLIGLAVVLALALVSRG